MKMLFVVSLMFVVSCNRSPSTISVTVDSTLHLGEWYQSIENKKTYKVSLSNSQGGIERFVRSWSEDMKRSIDSINADADKERDRYAKMRLLQQVIAVSEARLKIMKLRWAVNDSLLQHYLLTNSDDIIIVSDRMLKEDYIKVKNE